MKLDKIGTVLVPKEYQNWNAELTGDTDDTGGIYTFLYSPNHEDNFTFWDTTLEGIEEQFRNEGIVIDWKDSDTLKSFFSNSNLSKKIAKKILNNIYEKTEKKMVFNITQLEFAFDLSTVNLSYYAVDSLYPDIKFSFKQMENLLLDYLRK